MAASLLFYAALFQISDGLQVCAAGALRGFKDTKIPMFITLFAYWGIALPVGYSMGLTETWGRAWGPPGLWIGLAMGLSVSALLLITRLHLISRSRLAGP